MCSDNILFVNKTKRGRKFRAFVSKKFATYLDRFGERTWPIVNHDMSSGDKSTLKGLNFGI
jgi:hypothetical protein